MSLQLSKAVRVEELDGEAIVLDSTGSVVHRATGDAAEVLRLAMGEAPDADVPAHLAPAIATLTESGVLAPSGMSRRKMLLATGAGVVGGGLASFALATPAHALSVCPEGITPTTPTPATFDADGTFTTGPGVTSITVQAWGGGGGGARGAVGGGGNIDAGGGGGGGAFTTNSITVTECTQYSITVGGGGAGGTTAASIGGTGGTSSFGVAMLANGGAGAGGAAGGLGGAAGTFRGGNGANAQSAAAGGGGGGSAGAGGAGEDTATQTGGAAGAGTPPGAAGGNGGANNGAGQNGMAPGGGGGGAGMNGTAGSGAGGRVIVIVP